MENLFESLSHPDSVFFILSVLASFLIGFIAAWIGWGGKASRYRKEAEKWKKSYEDLTLEFKNLREQFDLKEADLVKAQREAEEAQDQLRAFYQDKAKWQSDLDSAMEDTVKLQASISSYQSTIDDLNNQILGLKARNSQLTRDAEKEGTALDQVAQMQSSFNATLNRIGSLEDKIALLVAENEKLRATNTGEDEQLSTMQKSYAEAAERIAVLESKMNTLVAENDSLHAELASLKTNETAVFETATPAEPAPVIHSDKEVLTEVVVPPSAAKDDVLAAIGAAIPPATAGEKDDLTKIKGIGSFLEKKLNSLGIYTYEQVSRFDADFIEKLTAAIEFFPGRIERDDWVGQAKNLLAKKTEPVAVVIHPDDLKKIEGIGPKIEKLLNAAGIRTFPDLAGASEEQLRNILQAAGERYRIHNPASWPDQAALAAKGDWERLKEYQDFLIGGKTS